MSQGYTTKSRTIILNYLQVHRERAMTIQEIYSFLQQEQIEVNLTTVYRYLNKLIQDGCVIKYVAKKGEQATFQYIGEHMGCQNHLHIQCRKCGKLLHLDCAFMDEFQEHIFKEHKFILQCSDSILFGLCEDCWTKENIK